MENKHTYSETFTITLPPGRYLKGSEIVQKGDLWTIQGNKPYSANFNIGEEVGSYNGKYQYLYRPDPKPKKPKPKYRLLKKGDVIKPGDQVLVNKKWLKHTPGLYGAELDGTEVYKRRRRLHIRTAAK